MTSQICVIGAPARLVGFARHGHTVLANPLVTAMVVSPPASQAERDGIWELRQTADRHDVAFVLADDLALVDQLMADGIEIEWNRDGYLAARERLGGGRSIGCRVGVSRHIAMEAAEAGADYVRFCEDQPVPGGSMKIAQMVQWWTPLFEVPCMAETGDDAAQMATLIAANVDFMAVDADVAAKGLEALMKEPSARRDVSQ